MVFYGDGQHWSAHKRLQEDWQRQKAVIFVLIEVITQLCRAKPLVVLPIIKIGRTAKGFCPTSILHIVFAIDVHPATVPYLLVSKLRRYYTPGKTYFITSVTHDRMPILLEQNGMFWNAVTKVKAQVHFNLIAWVVLPDHFHMIIDPLENNLSNLVRRMKLSFSYYYRERAQLYRGKLWQRRFWDHVIRDERDLNRHIDYIHYNPVKHGLVSSPFEWEQSSIHDYFKVGYYTRDWGKAGKLKFDDTFGE